MRLNLPRLPAGARSRVSAWALAAVLAGAICRGATPGEELAAIQKEFDTAMQTFMEAYGKATTDEQRQKIVEEKYPNPEKYTGRVLSLIEQDPGSPAALDGTIWVLSHGQTGEQATKLIGLLQRHHLTSEKLAPACQAFLYSNNGKEEEFLRAALDKNPHAAVQAAACLTLGRRLKNSDSTRAEAEKLLELCASKYASEKEGSSTVGEAAQAELFELRNLAIGKVAPDIEGEDVEGKPLRLADYRGKVVVIDFWGDW